MMKIKKFQNKLTGFQIKKMGKNIFYLEKNKRQTYQEKSVPSPLNQ